MFERTFSFWRRLVGKGSTATMDPPTKSDAAQADRRLWLRYPADLAAQVELNSGSVVGDKRVSARVRDISQGGVNLLVDVPIDSGQLITVELLPAGEQGKHTVLGCVVRSQPAGGDQWELGCVFSRELSDEDLEEFGAKAVRLPPSDKRGWKRFDSKLKATFQKVGDPENKSHPTQVMNLSASGVGLQVNTSIDAGALLSLELGGASGAVTHTILVCVVHTAQNGNDWTLGCNFIRQLSDEDIQALIQ